MILHQVISSVSSLDKDTYVIDNGEKISTSTLLAHSPATSASNAACSKIEIIIFYENYFRDGWVGVENDPIARHFNFLIFS